MKRIQSWEWVKVRFDWTHSGDEGMGQGQWSREWVMVRGRGDGSGDEGIYAEKQRRAVSGLEE